MTEPTPDLPEPPGLPVLSYAGPDIPDDIRAVCPETAGHVVAVAVFLPPMAAMMALAPLPIMEQAMTAAFATLPDSGISSFELHRAEGPNGECCIFLAEKVG
jgi:hypothetical protein